MVFHANPSLDQLDPNFNPHFDNVEDLKLTEFFQEDPDGLDCHDENDIRTI